MENYPLNDLQEKIPGSQIINEDDMTPLKEHSQSVIIFMGAGDIQKFQVAYESLLTHSKGVYKKREYLMIRKSNILPFFYINKFE